MNRDSTQMQHQQTIQEAISGDHIGIQFSVQEIEQQQAQMKWQQEQIHHQQQQSFMINGNNHISIFTSPPEGLRNCTIPRTISCPPAMAEDKEQSTDTSKENSKASEAKKQDYIHVRARRGEATDSHSLAERVRREKISERMKCLQDLVPGCNKIIGKAGMLDEIINYVQSLQTQVEFLSMRLANASSTIDYNVENLLNEEELETIGSSTMVNPANTQFSPQQVPFSEAEANVSPDKELHRTTSAPVSLPETLLDQSYFNQIQDSSVWNSDLENLYLMEFQQGQLSSSFSQPFTGYTEDSEVKLEM